MRILDNVDGVSAATRRRAKPNSRQNPTNSQDSHPRAHNDVAAQERVRVPLSDAEAGQGEREYYPPTDSEGAGGSGYRYR